MRKRGWENMLSKGSIFGHVFPMAWISKGVTAEKRRESAEIRRKYVFCEEIRFLSRPKY